jgi:hypothetical protein
MLVTVDKTVMQEYMGSQIAIVVENTIKSAFVSLQGPEDVV